MVRPNVTSAGRRNPATSPARAPAPSRLLQHSRRVCLLAALALLTVLAGACAFRGGSFREIEFPAPAQTDPALRPYLVGVERLGVLTATTLEPMGQLDVEKVMARLSTALARKLETLPDITVVTHDDISWHVPGVELDSVEVLTPASQQALIDSLAVDAIVVVELQHLQARSTPMAPGQFGMTSNPGLDFAVDLRVNLLNLHSGQRWQQSGQHRDWQPIRVQSSGSNQAERQLLIALGRPLERFLVRLAPPPRPQLRYFDVSGN